MNQQEKFNDTVGILVKAYLNDTLEAVNCAACAVGNIIAAKMCATPKKRDFPAADAWLLADGTEVEAEWSSVFCTSLGRQKRSATAYHGEAKAQIDITGYEWTELARIELAFECGSRIDDSREKDTYAGLMAVVDVLADIHGLDLQAATAAKSLFVKA